MRRALKALPTLMRVGFAEAIAYRAEMLVWVLSTTMPFVMLLLWSAVSQGGAVPATSGRSWTPELFTAYYLSMFVVRQLVSAWASWEINWEVRQGLLSARLLRPIHPILSYAVGNVAALPLRFVVSLPVFVGLLLSAGAPFVTRDWRLWLVWCVAMLGGWLVTFFANVCIGALSMYMDSSIKVMDVWITCFFVFSGYLFPMDVLPPWLRAVADWLPFRYMVGLPVELMVGQHGVAEALVLLARQLGWGVAFGVGAVLLWRGGVKRFQAYGG